jgi:hypothetical protein
MHSDTAAFDDVEATFTGLFDEDTVSDRRFVPGCEGVIRENARVLFVGADEEGKSLTVARLMEQVSRAGGRVVYVDHENGRPRTNERFTCLIPKEDPEWSDAMDRLEKQVIYAGPLNFRTLDNPLAMSAWVRYLHDVDLLVLDSLPRILASLGLDEDSNRDVARFFSTYIDPIIQDDGCRTSVLILDNIGHEGRRSRGASAKEDLVELAYLVSGGKSCSLKDHGTITLRRIRSRDGDEIEHLKFGAGGGRYTDVVAASASDSQLRHEAAVAVLRESGPMSKNALTKAVRERGLKFNTQEFKHEVDGWDDVSEDADGRLLAA